MSTHFRFPFWLRSVSMGSNASLARELVSRLGLSGNPDPSATALFGQVLRARRSFYKTLLLRWLPLVLWRSIRILQSPLGALRTLWSDYRAWSHAGRKAEYYVFSVLENPSGINSSTYSQTKVIECTQEHFAVAPREFANIKQALMARVPSGKLEKFPMEIEWARPGVTWKDTMITRAMNHKNDMWAIQWRLERKCSEYGK